jgi:Transposase, Mutator family
MACEHGDLLRDAVALVVRELMEAEVAQLTGAERGERSPERMAHLNGYCQGSREFPRCDRANSPPSFPPLRSSRSVAYLQGACR